MSVSDQIHGSIARLAFGLWPFHFAHERLMKALNPPRHQGTRVRRLRGFPLQLEFDAGSYLGRFLDYRGMYEEALIRTMADVLRPGGCMIDVGANIGLHTVIAAHRVGPTGRVLALEPQRLVSERLTANVRLNRLENVTIRRVAASTHVGELVLHQVTVGNDGQATLGLLPEEHAEEHETVPVRSLDDIVDEALGDAVPDVLKMDVEGAELDVLRSAPRIFASRAPRYVFVECIERHLNRFDATSGMLVQWLNDAGYTVRGLQAGRWRSATARDGLNLDLLATR